MTPTVCIKALRAPFFVAAFRTGLPISALADELEVLPALLTDVSARVPHTMAVRVWDRLAEIVGEPSFGLVAAEFIGAAPLDLLDFALVRAPTLRELLARFMRYQRLFHDANEVTLVIGDKTGILHHRFAGDLPRSRHFTEFILAMWTTRFLNAIVSDATRVISFRHGAPPDLARHRAMFGDVRFDAEHDALEFPSSLLDVALRFGEPAPTATLDAELAERNRSQEPEAFADRVRRLLVASIHEGDVDLDAIARAVACSRRTLQRRLTEDGTSYRAVLDDARRQVALETVARGSVTVTDLTFLLGFSDLSAFGRAFRRWTGTNPASYLAARR